MLNVLARTLEELALVKPGQALSYYINLTTGDSMSISVFTDDGRFLQVKISEFIDLAGQYDACQRAWADRPAVVPRPLGCLQRDRRSVMVCEGVLHTTVLRADVIGRGWRPHPAIARQLLEYFDAKRSPSGACSAADEQAKLVRELAGHFETTPLAVIASAVVADAIAAGVESLPSTPQHGDFVLNNLGRAGSRLVVFDWEDYGKVCVPGLDILTLCVSLLDDDVDALRRLMRGDASGRSDEIDELVRRACRAQGIEVALFRRLVPFYLLVFLYLKRSYGTRVQERFVAMLQGLSRPECGGARRTPESDPKPNAPRPPPVPAATATAASAAGAPRLGGDLLRGSLWMLGARWAIRILGLVSTLILVRLLAPEDFGLVAMIMLVYSVLETVSYAGTDLALLREARATREYFDTAWTLQILQGLLIAALLLAFSPWIASYFSEPRITTLMFWVAPRAVIDGMQNIGVVGFRKELDFAREFRYSVVSKAASVVVVIAAALWFRNYWALIIGALVASVIGVFISYAMHPFRPRLSLAKTREIYSFSQWLMLSQVGSILNRKCDEFVVGGSAGTASMGSYHVANEIATMPSGELVMPVRRALFPTLAKLMERPHEFAAAVVSSFAAVSAACLFIGATLMATAPQFVAVILGPKWLDAVGVFRWLAIFGGLTALAMVLEVPIWVSGRTRVSAFQTWFELALIAPLSWAAVHRFGMDGAAASRVAVALAMVPLMMWLATSTNAVTFGRLWAVLWRPLVAGAAIVAVDGMISGVGNGLVVLLVKLALCVLTYPAVMLLLWAACGRPDGIERLVIAYASSRLFRKEQTR